MRPEQIRGDFPFFEGADAPVYLDSAATAQKPKAVLERMTHFYAYENANIHRGGYALAEHATRSYEAARACAAEWIGARPEQTAFTLNATDALNIACAMIAKKRLARGCNVVTTALEHNSAFLPWAAACREKGAELRVLPLDAQGIPEISRLETLTDRNTVAAVITAGANSTGWNAPLDEMMRFFRGRGVPVVVDATQRVPHDRLNFNGLGCDFLCFSGHKLYGPLGVGVMAMRKEWAEEGYGRLGGGMVEEATEKGFVRAKGVQGLEAGTPPVAEAIGLQAAIEYLQNHTPEECWRNERALADALRSGLAEIPGVHVLAAGENSLPVVAFYSERIHPVDLAQMLQMRGIALRCGKHCAHVAHERMGLDATLRASIGIYNTQEDVDALLTSMREIMRRWEKRYGR